MSRKITGALTAIVFALLLPSSSPGLITFIPGPARPVPTGPYYVSAADFNRDGIDDAVVSHISRDRVVVLFGSVTGDPLSVLEIPVGRNLRGVTTGDFNSDRFSDIAVADLLTGQVFLIFGRGDGTFTGPQGFAGARRGPVDVIAGEFDGRPGLDLAAANGPNDSFTVFVNEGGNRGLRSTGNLPTGQNPRDIESHDINNDNFDDLFILNTGTRGTDEVSVYLNTGTGTFSGVTAQKYVVGINSVGQSLGDFNNDGRMDLVVLNQKAVRANEFSISVLLGQSTPIFQVIAPLVFTCPTQLNGISITCTPQDIAAGDYDGDSFVDIAITFSTRATSSDAVTAGFVNAYAGRGNGQFEFASQTVVGVFPRGLYTGDYNGDAAPDLAVVAQRDNTARFLISRTPEPLDNGANCNLGRQCASRNCVDGVCCASASCPEGQRCDIFPPDVSEPDGVCKFPAPNGSQCTDGDQCASGACVDGFCCSSRLCPINQFCNSGQCSPPAGNGIPCSANQQCASGFCTDGVCCSDPRCAVNAACNIPGSEGTCTQRQRIGSPCTDPAQCCTDPIDPTKCDPSFCIDGFCCERECPSDQTCGAPGFEGVCVMAPTRTPTPQPTPTPQMNGAPCSNAQQCQSGFCTNNVCCNTAQCPAGMSCSIPGKNGSCQQSNPGDPCDDTSDCAVGVCVPTSGSSGVCALPSPTPRPTPGGPGSICSSSTDCQGPSVCNTEEGGICCNLAQCPAGMNCRNAGREGQCSIPPTPRRDLGTVCAAGTQCESENCVDGVCCELAQCLSTERCDIPGFEGFCQNKPGENGICSKNEQCPSGLRCDIPRNPGRCTAPQSGDPCSGNNECPSGLLCLGNPPRCNPPASPTPTLFIPPPNTPTRVIVSNVNRSGGCAIDTRSDGNGLLLLGSLPFALWMRRRYVTALARVRK